jgi:hypothetical protein
MYDELFKDESNECLICFDEISQTYKTSCKICNMHTHNDCWKKWESKSVYNKNKCFQCGQKNCLEFKKRFWLWDLFYCFFPFLDKKNKSI